MAHFVQLHVHKTGGSSLIVYAHKNRLHWNSGDHSPFLKRTIPKGSIVITALRCPIRRVISMFSGGWGESYVFSEWLRNPVYKNGKVLGASAFWGFNSYVRFFGTGPNDFDGAVTNIRSVNYVLDTSHLTRQFNELVAAKYRLPHFNVHENKSKIVGRPIASKDDIKYIKKNLEADFEICRMFGIETDQ